MDLKKYRQIFLDETTEDLNTLEGLILRVEEIPSDKESVRSIFRLFHRLKSSSAMMGYTRFSELSHRAEDLLSLIDEEKIVMDKSISTLLLSVVDTLRRLIMEAESGNIVGLDLEELLERLKGYSIGRREEGTRLSSPNVSNPGESVLEAPATPIHQGLNVVRIDEGELNDLIDMAGELISAIAELDRSIHLLEHISSLKDTQIVSNQIAGIKRKVGKISLSIHNRLLRSKMIPAGEIFERLKRVVHDLSVKTNKCIQVLMMGTEIEMDRAIVDKLFNPLLHIVRNAVDHGIEEEEERLRSGKSPISTITLSSSLQGHYVTISIEDDGRGIDLEKIKKTALKRGLFDEKTMEDMGEKELIDLIFQPGFTTKEETTEISGRGMGLDIVKENVKGLKGEVEVFTKSGKGTVIKITLPQTLSIIRCLQVIIGDETFSIPVESIVEIIPANPECLITAQKRPLLLLRGSPIAIADLYEIMKIRQDSDKVTAYVIVGNGTNKIALSVVAIMGEQDLLIKHLGEFFCNVEGILGTGILGEGRLSLIIDTDYILRHFRIGRSAEEFSDEKACR